MVRKGGISTRDWLAKRFCCRSCKDLFGRAVRTPIADRFWKKVRRKHPSQCWVWLGATDGPVGAGIIHEFGKVAPSRASRVSWELHYGKIPAGLFVCHACDNPSCVNPQHLLLGSQRANVIDAVRKKRLNKKSELNLRPGALGYHGAGPKSQKELQDGISE